MIEVGKGTIIKELFSRPGIRAFSVELEGREEKCILYPDLTGEVQPGDTVLLNTSAVSLGLGSGGYHYIIANLNGQTKSMQAGGHIMKLRYTPMQVKVLSVEEEESPHHLDMLAADSLESTPVLVATLHSMLAPMCIHLHDLGLRVVYVMTDGAALPISFSQNVDWLKRQGILAAAVTCGHAFGGDLEAVNIYSGLLAARKVAGADVIIVSMGPGIVGTGTRWGFTGIEQGEILNAADTLGGKPVVVPRISFADPRPRHRGISHHTLTVLSRVCRTKAVLPLPELEENKMSMVLGQLLNDRLFERYDVCLENTPELLKRLETCGLRITTMGRNVEEEKEFFLSLGAAAQAAYRLFKGENLRKINLA